MKKEKNTDQEAEVEIGDFGPIYRQFAGKPQKAIEFLRKMQTGEVLWLKKDTKGARNNGF